MRWQLLILKVKSPDFKARGPATGWSAAVLLLGTCVGMVFAGEPGNPIFAQRAQKAFQRAQAGYLADTNNATAAWQFARACDNLDGFVTNNAGRADLASQGIAACRQLLAHESNSVPGHYYLAIEIGHLADTKRNLAALKTVREMEREFKTADDLDEHFDYAGPARCLGLLYRDAPGWPLSIGSRHKARDWLEQAVTIAPEYPDNHLNLIESYWQWKDHDDASNALQRLDALWPAARTNFIGEAWEYNWDDWIGRREAAREKIVESPLPKGTPKTSRN